MILDSFRIDGDVWVMLALVLLWCARAVLRGK